MQAERINPSCEIAFSAFWRDDGTPCGKPSVAQCADCGFALCEKCRTKCYGDSLCASCYEYHLSHGRKRKICSC
jgi:hypothetical protein